MAGFLILAYFSPLCVASRTCPTFPVHGRLLVAGSAMDWRVKSMPSSPPDGSSGRCYPPCLTSWRIDSPIPLLLLHTTPPSQPLPIRTLWTTVQQQKHPHSSLNAYQWILRYRTTCCPTLIIHSRHSHFVIRNIICHALSHHHWYYRPLACTQCVCSFADIIFYCRFNKEQCVLWQNKMKEIRCVCFKALCTVG